MIRLKPGHFMIWKSHLYEAAGKENTHTPEPAGLQAPGLPRLRPAPCPAPLGSTWQDHEAATQEAGSLSESLDKQPAREAEQVTGRACCVRPSVHRMQESTGCLSVCVCVCVCVCACVCVSGPVYTGCRRALAPERRLMGLGWSCQLASDKRPRRQRPGPTAHMPHGAQEAAEQDSWEHCSHSAEATSCPDKVPPPGRPWS